MGAGGGTGEADMADRVAPGDFDVVVVGAGLAGLTAADTLHRAGMSVRVVEARGRVGGRVMTASTTGAGDGGWLDLGATWLWSDQSEVRSLAQELGLATFHQYRSGRALVDDGPGAPPAPIEVPPTSPAELRVVGGAQQLCAGLADRLPVGAVSYATSVVGLRRTFNGLTAELVGADGVTSELAATFAIVAAPPRLVLQNIRFGPALPADLVAVLEATPTWMATAVKCVAVYGSAFWRDAGWSGLALGGGGPLVEVHDACAGDGSVAALWGFVSADHAFRDLTPDRRTPLVLAQLGRLFGPAAADPVAYYERDWSNDPNTNDEVVWIGDVLAYGHPLFESTAMGGRLAWAGTETVAAGGGHMEGAVRSGQRAARLVLGAAGVVDARH